MQIFMAQNAHKSNQVAVLPQTSSESSQMVLTRTHSPRETRKRDLTTQLK